MGKTNVLNLVKGIARIFIKTRFEKTIGRERGYVYFQDFIPDNDHDYRVIVIENKAFAIKRQVRKNDFRASGRGILSYKQNLFSKILIELAFEISKKTNMQCIAMDLIYTNEQPLLVEISYGFPYMNFIEGCEGYWDIEMNWHKGKFNPYGWMVDVLIGSIKNSKKT